MRRITEEWFEKHDFIDCPAYSTTDLIAHKLRFPVYRHDTSIVIQCELIVWDNGKYMINVYDGEYGRARYASWYLRENCDIVRTIKKRINKKLKELGLKHYEQVQSPL